MAKCKHEETMYIDEYDAYYCWECKSYVAFRCRLCGGQGHVYEDDYRQDFINYGHNLILCPECRGHGFVEDLTWQ